ncbi:2-amino-4-hydroxy-6-hydroxymethyldihydropteridine diphosphokinase [Isoptericola sp. NEAU-Y5]|uniref:Bifunctional folate synthesis protein n=1 Tax=Isoptericola luteus TaxID=2879484 RepID=A0ABS7ZGU9_9MICO|nr:2-amino-4-hydroxy-6-hydroxymethyldihydropteridine diphosphokinase [Isoptericola sp. NEAU-Y5]MCA5893074.1 2-amino-4-hydroxy-6-hydroxymethyldihydropteridine diphosphokinase [Isoptericola sp. NEAU-Y5]
MTFAEAVTGPHGRPLDRICLEGVSATGHHGVLPHERVEGQVFRADVVLHLDTRAAATSDDLAATVSYADVAQDVHDVLAGSPADLVETVAERIAAVVLDRPAVHAVDVRVHKPQAPIEVPFDDVSIVIRRDREHAPVVATPAVSGAEPRTASEVAGDQRAEASPSLGLAGAAAAEPSYGPAVVAPTMADALADEPVGAEPFGAESFGAEAFGAEAFGTEPAGAAEAPETAEPAEADVAPYLDPLDAAPARPIGAVLALGANLGDAQVTLRDAVTDIDRVPGIQVTDVSPLARTAAVGGPDQPDFLNAVLIVKTTLSPRDLLRAVQQVEELHGRVREERWGPRTLDVDIVQYDTLTTTSDDLELPHPRAHERAFVLVPWAEVAPDAVLGGLGGGPVSQLAVTAPDRAGIRWLALDWLTGPTQSTGQVATDGGPAPSAPVQSVSVERAPAVAPDARSSEPETPQAPPTPPHGYASEAPQGYAPEGPRDYAPEAPRAYSPQPSQGYAPEAPQGYAPEGPRDYAPEAPQGYAPETPRAYVPEVSTSSTPQAPLVPIFEVPSAPQPPAPPVTATPHAPVPPAPSTSQVPAEPPASSYELPLPYDPPAQQPAYEPAPQAYQPPAEPSYEVPDQPQAYQPPAMPAPPEQQVYPAFGEPARDDAYAVWGPPAPADPFGTSAQHPTAAHPEVPEAGYDPTERDR